MTKHLVLVGRLIFGAWMLINGANHFFGPFYAEPTGTQPLAVQLMTSLVNSKLFDVAMAIQLVTGALILSGFLVPLALCVVAPVSTCALFWAAILEHEPLGAVLALAAFALNGLLMLAYIDSYKDMLKRRAVTLGEADDATSFDTLFANPFGRTARGPFFGALIVLIAAAAFFYTQVPGRTGQWVLATLIVPYVLLLARRLHDMGVTAWLLIAPAALLAAMFWLRLYDADSPMTLPVTAAALVVAVGFAVWGALGKEAGANKFGAPA
jgi:uncharacterized membrane protein YhaH (DUF805 family)